ncbi:MAG: shikimate dehydrogenase [Dehalococcoidia bacterium]|nr:shikimate dehydrogenase [Dehalococcoidia bacterium]
MTRLVTLIGYPLKHSVSAVFQQAAFSECGLDLKYENWETPEAELAGAVDRLRGVSIAGANVTIPCKEKIVPLLDELSDTAQRISAVNTVVNRDGRLMGFNTDVEGFVSSLLHDAGYRLRNRKVVLLGAGGVARAVMFALLNQEVTWVTVFNRSVDRGRALVRAFTRSAGRIPLTALPWEDLETSVALKDCDLLVNCTSIGMRYSSTEGETPLVADLIPKDALVYDLVYNPEETPFLREAKKAGAETLGGLSMLIHQGAASFELWTGRKAPLDIMFRSAREALARGA